MRNKPAILRLAGFYSCALACIGLIAVYFPADCRAHGVAGKRFFPATLSVDDPFVSDELSVIYSHSRDAEEEANELSFALGKRITRDFGLEIGGAYSFLKPDGEPEKQGFGNLEIGAKYQLLTSDQHEFIISVGLDAEIGGTGARSAGADSFSTISPAVLFGKGFGDLPDSVWYLRPFAITGTIGPNFPTRSKNTTLSEDPDTGLLTTDIERNPVTLGSGITIQYNLQYLQTHVRDIGLPPPFNRMIPLVEFPIETCLNRGCEGAVTGFANPGVIWFGKSIQLGLEAQVPLNRGSGRDVGVLFMLHFFLDDLFPTSIGKPIFDR